MHKAIRGKRTLIKRYEQPQRLSEEKRRNALCDSLNFAEMQRGESEAVFPPERVNKPSWRLK